MLNPRIIFNILGLLLLFEGFFMLLCVPVSLLYNEGHLFALSLSAAITVACGGLMWLITKNAEKNIGKRDGYLIVSLGWAVFSLFGSLPFYITGEIPSFTDAFFETMSGFSTTGASILNDVEALPHSLHFWRSIIQWLGGMGIIVMSVAILPILGIGGMQLYVAEVPGPTKDKIHPRIKDTATRFWGIYILFTLIQVLLLWLGGMTIFDAVCHSFTTMATGGYSTKQDSIAHFDSPFIQYVIIVFMFIAGINFTLSYFALHFRFSKVFGNEEFRYYAGFVGLFTLIITLVLFVKNHTISEQLFRDSLFQVLSILTTTGFVTADYNLWHPFLVLLLFMIMFIGGSAGSTGGGMKVVRITLLIKNSYLEFKRLIHPNALIPIRMNGTVVSSQIIHNVLSFAVIYFIIIITGALVISLFGYDMPSSFSAAAACLGNIGPGIGAFGPMENFAHVPAVGKWFLSFLMLLGRLELFTVLILFSGHFWKK